MTHEVEENNYTRAIVSSPGHLFLVTSDRAKVFDDETLTHPARILERNCPVFVIDTLASYLKVISEYGVGYIFAGDVFRGFCDVNS